MFKLISSFSIMLLLCMPLNTLATEISVKVPVKAGNDTVLTCTAGIKDIQGFNIISLTNTGDFLEGNINSTNSGLVTVIVSLSLSTGETLSDSAKTYLASDSDPKQVEVELNSNCFNTTMMVYWLSAPPITAADLYNYDLDTSLVKRISIHNIDSIADKFYDEGLYWYRSMPVHYYILDSNMIPLVEYSSGFFRNTVTTSQTAFAFYEQYQQTLAPEDRQGFINNANWLATNNHAGYFYYEFDFWHTSGVQLNNNWVSAMAQGEALGALSLAYYFLGDSKYLEEANRVFNTFLHNSSEFWTFLLDDQGYYWLEEYPNNDLCHVLNGKMAALWGIFQYYTITRNKQALRVLEAGLKTAMDHYKIWNVENSDNSYYCTHNQIKAHYHAVHKNQFLTFAQRFNQKRLYDAYYCLANNETRIIPESICFNYLADTMEVTVESPFSWSVSEQADWLIAEKLDGKIVVYVDTNLTGTLRSTEIAVIIDNGDVLQLSILQEPKDYYIHTELDTLFFNQKHDSISVVIKTNDTDLATICYEDWIDYYWLSDTLLSVVANQNTGTSLQEGEITLVAQHTQKKIHLIQEAAALDISSPPLTYRIYPNPVGDEFYVELDNVNNLGYDLYSIHGVLVKSGSLNNGKTSIDIARFPAATYILQLRNPKGEIINTQEIIKR